MESARPEYPARSFVSGALFAFIASFDNYPVSIFLVDVRTKTLPIQLLNQLEMSPDPTVAAASSLLILATIIALFDLRPIGWAQTNGFDLTSVSLTSPPKLEATAQLVVPHARGRDHRATAVAVVCCRGHLARILPREPE